MLTLVLRVHFTHIKLTIDICYVSILWCCNLITCYLDVTIWHFQDPAAVVVDHSGYAVSATEGDHTLIASDDFININLLFSRYMQQAPVLKVLSASPITFSANPKSKVTTPPSLTGTSIIQA
uniref:Uncharacterized protein n=1 Tax=Glycine max TaxID=3847 RepID=A0A0R0GDX0_SOYBN